MHSQEHAAGSDWGGQALRRSDICRSRTRPRIFLGTPHWGSACAEWGRPNEKLRESSVKSRGNGKCGDYVVQGSERVKSDGVNEVVNINGMKSKGRRGGFEDRGGRRELNRSCKPLGAGAVNFLCGDRSDPQGLILRGVYSIVHRRIRMASLGSRGRGICR